MKAHRARQELTGAENHEIETLCAALKEMLERSCRTTEDEMLYRDNLTFKFHFCIEP